MNDSSFVSAPGRLGVRLGLGLDIDRPRVPSWVEGAGIIGATPARSAGASRTPAPAPAPAVPGREIETPEAAAA